MTQPYSDDDRVAALRRLVSNQDNVSLTVRELRAEGMPTLTRETLIGWRDTLLSRAESVPLSVAVGMPADTPADTLEEAKAGLAVRLVREVAYEAFGHLRDIASWDADGRLTFIPSDELDYASSAGIQSIEYETKDDMVGEGEKATVIRTTKIKVKRESKLGAQGLMAKILGLVQTGTPINVDARTVVLPPMTLDEYRAGLAQFVGES